MKNWILSLGLGLSTMVMTAQDYEVFFVGHSLSDYIPEMMASFGQDRGLDLAYGYAQIIGSPLRYQWSCLSEPDHWPGNFPDAHIYAFYDQDHGLPTGRYGHLVLNEGVPRLNNNWGIEETFLYVDSFYQYARQFNPDIALYLSELWHCLDSGTPTGCDYDEDSNPWRQRLDDDLSMWERAVDFINEKYQPATPMQLIPSGQALAALYDSIESGYVSGIHSIDQVFEDRIHGNDTVRYLVACVNYASITKTSPIGLTSKPKRWWGGDFGEIPEPLALQLQKIAWEVVCRYPKNDIHCDITGVSDNPETSEQITFFPNPSRGEIFVRHGSNCLLQIIDIQGRAVAESTLSGRGVTVVRTNLQPGLYFVRSDISKSMGARLLIH